MWSLKRLQAPVFSLKQKIKLTSKENNTALDWILDIYTPLHLRKVFNLIMVGLKHTLRKHTDANASVRQNQMQTQARATFSVMAQSTFTIIYDHFHLYGRAITSLYRPLEYKRLLLQQQYTFCKTEPSIVYMCCVEYISGFMVRSHPALYDLKITCKICGSGYKSVC